MELISKFKAYLQCNAYRYKFSQTNDYGTCTIIQFNIIAWVVYNKNELF